MREVSTVLAIVSVMAICAPSSRVWPLAADAEQTTTVELRIFVALVSSDLQVKPVPKHKLIVRASTSPTSIEGSTGFDGKWSVRMPPGEYSVASAEPVTFEGAGYTWKQTIQVPPEGTTLELSNDNAIRTVNQDVHDAGPTDEARIFEAARPAVVTVVAQAGTGTGFLVHQTGLILTNQHVVDRSEYLAVKIDEDRKYKAVLVADSAQSDVAVLLVNPAIFESAKPLELSESSRELSPVKIGDRVIAIGSPLGTEGLLTTGIVSKVEEDAIYSDVSINPGNSGGPLLNVRGKVIGISTFGIDAGHGPGVSGIVRIHVAKAVINQALDKLSTIQLPDAVRLPEVPRRAYPVQGLSQMVSEEVDPADYHLEAGKFDVQLITPVLIASLEKRAEIRAEKQREKRARDRHTEPADASTTSSGDGFYEWRRYGGDYQPVVRIQAVPEIRQTGGSFFAQMMLGPNAAPGRFRFKTDFRSMRLLNGAAEVLPYHPGKIRQVVSQSSGFKVIEDVGIYGAYTYPPEVFHPDNTLVLEVYDEDRPDEPKRKEIPKILQEKIWNDFQPYFASLKERENQEQKTGVHP